MGVRTGDGVLGGGVGRRTGGGVLGAGVGG